MRALWTPGAERMAASQLGRYLAERGADGYDQLWRWSVADGTAGEFWADMARLAGVRWHRPPKTPLQRDPDRVAGVAWFPGGQLNYAERALQPPDGDPGAVAVIAHSQTRGTDQLTWADLGDLTGRVRAGLVAAGVVPGDRVAGYLPNIPEALAAMLATVSLGATWTCCSPDMGPAGVLDRFAQVEPSVLIAVDGYRYGPRQVPRRDEAESLRRELSSLKAAVWLPYLDPGGSVPAGWSGWDGFTSVGAPLEFASVDFDHPLYILFSSGTTGRPKAIIHGHGGVLVEHAKALALHFDLGAGDRFFWYTTTGWMMWNFVVSGLLVGSTVVLFDGDPSWPEPDALWRLAAAEGVTCLGVGAAFLVACMRQGMNPGADHDLSGLRTLGSTGSPLPAAAAEWVYRAVGSELMLGSFSGGTDVCTGFVGPSPLHPVWAGEISCRCLGARVEVFDDEGRPVVGEEGELVLTAPLPSMPVRFWGDPDGTRYRAAYFERFLPSVWAHGDRASLTDRGTVIITGRSDGTLNRGGVRMGTAEFYAVVEARESVLDSLVVHVEDPGGGPGELWLFVVPAPGVTDLDRQLEEIRADLRRELSPRHVPDHMVAVPSVPRTLTGKKLEVPVKRLLAGVDPARALAVEAVADPGSLEPFLALANKSLR